MPGTGGFRVDDCHERRCTIRPRLRECHRAMPAYKIIRTLPGTPSTLARSPQIRQLSYSTTNKEGRTVANARAHLLLRGCDHKACEPVLCDSTTCA